MVSNFLRNFIGLGRRFTNVSEFTNVNEFISVYNSKMSHVNEMNGISQEMDVFGLDSLLERIKTTEDELIQLESQRTPQQGADYSTIDAQILEKFGELDGLNNQKAEYDTLKSRLDSTATLLEKSDNTLLDYVRKMDVSRMPGEVVTFRNDYLSLQDVTSNINSLEKEVEAYEAKGSQLPEPMETRLSRLIEEREELYSGLSRPSWIPRLKASFDYAVANDNQLGIYLPAYLLGAQFETEVTAVNELVEEKNNQLVEYRTAGRQTPENPKEGADTFETNVNAPGGVVDEAEIPTNEGEPVYNDNAVKTSSEEKESRFQKLGDYVRKGLRNSLLVGGASGALLGGLVGIIVATSTNNQVEDHTHPAPVVRSIDGEQVNPLIDQRITTYAKANPGVSMDDVDGAIDSALDGYSPAVAGAAVSIADVNDAIDSALDGYSPAVAGAAVSIADVNGAIYAAISEYATANPGLSMGDVLYEVNKTFNTAFDGAIAEYDSANPGISMDDVDGAIDAAISDYGATANPGLSRGSVQGLVNNAVNKAISDYARNNTALSAEEIRAMAKQEAEAILLPQGEPNYNGLNPVFYVRRPALEKLYNNYPAELSAALGLQLSTLDGLFNGKYGSDGTDRELDNLLVNQTNDTLRYGTEDNEDTLHTRIARGINAQPVVELMLDKFTEEELEAYR